MRFKTHIHACITKEFSVERLLSEQFTQIYMAHYFVLTLQENNFVLTYKPMLKNYSHFFKITYLFYKGSIPSVCGQFYVLICKANYRKI
jgi:hypothetical protein